MRQMQHLKQGQNLALTPKLQQSIQMLQMSTLDLVDLIQVQVLENPFLQIEETSEVPEWQQNYNEDPHLGDLQSETYSNFWTDVGTKSSQYSFEDQSNWIEETVMAPLSLKSHLLQQLETKTKDPHTLLIGYYLVDLVDDDGLIRANLDQVALDLNIKILDVLAVLTLLQSFDPVGVCARTLEESFAIQLSDQNVLSDSLNRILQHLSKLPTKGIQGVAKLADISLEEFKKALQLFRTLNPRPGESFQSVSFTKNTIDIFIIKDSMGEWVCELNEESLPKVYVDSDLYHELKLRRLKAGDAAYLSSQLSAANWLVKAVHQRSNTILKVCQALVTHQASFFEKGPSALKPMALKDLALELGVHESTVSRAINAKYLQTIWGVFELKYFFCAAVRNGVEDQSNRSIQAAIKVLIEREDKLNPLSDDQLVSSLQNKGIIVARRTIAKYRDALKIPSSFERKKQAQLMTF
ncbi:RNA polymerase factor sigma-54 [Candidatus Paracaedibacter symbiosus]|uniref:RNA polymerase factor sigma-54 n=1 Tax=Candidatus Paracaedibacter symbiosus TaxID=244582 RepID=UPI000509D5E6|nr:RNA polymerase factor sigma-54 [Candidatus Paracaedibacter symbiosus]